MRKVRIGWWSAGITSSVACKAALELFDNVELYYIDTGKVHIDNTRFKADCEKWYGQEIKTIKNSGGYKNPIDVIYKERYINGPDGAKCTQKLKKEVRFELEQSFIPNLFDPGAMIENQIFGFEFDKSEVNRAIRFIQQYPNTRPLFPLIEKGLTKDNCAGMIINAGIELPAMYTLGYPNNNCIGCVKGGMAYWNKIRVDFPESFTETAQAERHLNRSCIQGTFLDELNPAAGRGSKIVLPNCGSFCEVEFADLQDRDLEEVLSGRKLIYDCAI